jgi:hypothetical protein
MERDSRERGEDEYTFHVPHSATEDTEGFGVAKYNPSPEAL